MNRFERVLLYIGAPKTGTTSVQIMLWQNRPALMEQGIYIPLAGRAGTDQHIALPAIVLRADHREDLDRHANLRGVDRETRRRDFLRDLDDEVAAVRPCHTLLLFSEHMFYSTVAEIPGYRTLFSNYAPALECLMYLRRQDRWLASLDLQVRKAVADTDFGLNAMPPKRYGAAVRAWDKVADRCHIRRYQTGSLVRGDVVADFCATIGLDDARLSTSGVHANRSILQEQVELMDALNARLRSLPPARRVIIRRGFLPLCAEVLGGTKFTQARDRALTTFRAYQDINRWLRVTRDPDGPEYFFDEDFSDYEIHPSNDRRYTRAQLGRLLSVIRGRLESGGATAAGAGDLASRTALIGAIASAFISLRRAELRGARETPAHRPR
ncbi:MAG: hypothetical protein H0X27_00725 [Caulobacteraceae bacterium]|nr:hypothetical protein [Caulobacteraceae bacterium]